MNEREALNANERLAVGIDIGGTSAKAVLLAFVPTGAGAMPRTGVRMIASGQSARYSRPTADEVRAAVGAALAEPAAAAQARGRAELVAVGLCCPGVIDKAGSAVVRSVNMPGLVGVPLSSLVGASLSGVGGWDGRVVHCPDALAAAMDYWVETLAAAGKAAADGSDRLLAISLGTGVGASVLDDGVPLRVSGQSPGHLGQVDVGPIARVAPTGWVIEEPIGPDGGRGSLEAFIGLPALRERYGQGLGEWLKHPRLDDPPIVALIRALRIAHAIYRPGQVALLGGVGVALGRAPMAGALQGAVSDRLTSLARPDWTLRFGRHALHAAAGAARLAVDMLG